MRQLQPELRPPLDVASIPCHGEVSSAEAISLQEPLRLSSLGYSPAAVESMPRCCIAAYGYDALDLMGHPWGTRDLSLVRLAASFEGTGGTMAHGREANVRS